MSYAVSGWIYTMSLKKDLLSHPALIEERIRLISDETTDTANRKDLIDSHRCLPTRQTKRSSGVMTPSSDQ